MDIQKKNSSRKKFIIWGSAALASVSLFRFFRSDKNKPAEKIKMLTQDGKLVEVDAAQIKKTGNKISNTAIHNWIAPTQKS